jgi:hypothetical protein
MPVQYETVKLTLGKTHKMKLRKAMGSLTPVTLKLSVKNLSGKEDSLVVTRTMKDRMEKTHSAGLGTTLKLTQALLKANRAQTGGSIATFLPLAMDAYSAAKEAVDASPGAQKIRNRLAYLKQLQGGGVVPTAKLGSELGQLVAQGDSEAKKLVKELKKNQSGSGQTGAGGWEDFWEGFKFSFTNPIEGLELVGREIGEAIEAPKRKARAEAKEASDQLLKLVNETTRKAQSKQGSGITFY